MPQGNHDQSIGTQTDQPVDGIAGSHPGTQEPAGAHVDAGRTRHGAVQRDDGNEQSAVQPATKRTGSFANQRSSRAPAPVAGDASLMGGAGDAFQGGSGDSMQGGAESRGQRISDVAHAGAPGGTMQRGDLVQRGSAGSRGN